MQISFQVPAFSSFGDISSRGIAGLHNHFILNILRKHHTAFHCGCTILHFHQECTKVPIPSHPCLHLSFSGVLFVCFYTNHPIRCEVPPLLLNLILNFLGNQNADIFDLIRSWVRLSLHWGSNILAKVRHLSPGEHRPNSTGILHLNPGRCQNH